MKRLFEEARRWIRLSSVSHSGDEELANYLFALLQDRHFKASLQHVTHASENVSKRQFNVLGILGDPLVDRKIHTGLLLVSHIDTSGPGMNENWVQAEMSPFQAVQKDGLLYGLGAVQGKIDFLCKLLAMERFRERKLKMPVYLLGTCGAEVGGIGARYMIKSFALNPKYVLAGFPTQNQLVFQSGVHQVLKATVGFQLVERDARGFNRRAFLTVRGKSAHSSSPEHAINALDVMFSFIEGALDAGFELRFSQIGGGDLTRQVPDLAHAEIQLMSHQLEDFKRFFREYALRNHLERNLVMELGGIGETGMRFLPEEVFTAVLALVGVHRKFQVENAKSGATSTLMQVEHQRGRIDLSFDLYTSNIEGASASGDALRTSFSEIMAQHPSFNFQIMRDRITPPLNTAPSSDWAKILTEVGVTLGVGVQVGPIPIGYDAGFFHEAGFPTAVIGPGTFAGNSHSPDENCEIAEFEKAIQFYCGVIERVCS